MVCAGQLQTRKGVFEYAKLAEQLPQMQFVWAGDFTFGNMSDGYKDIEKLLKEHPQNLHFTGLVERDKMPQVYQMGDVMLLPSFDELFPMTVLEAMSCHVPILLRDLDLYPVILDGYYLKAQDNAGFAEELNKLSQQPQYYEQAVQMSRKGNDFYSEEHVLSMWRDFYHGLLGESQRRQNKPILKKYFQWLREEYDESRYQRLCKRAGVYCRYLCRAVYLAAQTVQYSGALEDDARNAALVDSGSDGIDGGLLGI